MKMNSFRALEARVTMLLTDESGMSTVEYAIFVYSYPSAIRQSKG